MEQMYLIEIFIDKVTIFASDEDAQSGANKKLIIKIKFGPKTQFIIKEGQLALNQETKDDIIECDEQGRRKYARTIRVGKSYLFPSFPDTILMILAKFPLEIEVWNDDENEVEIFVGVGQMVWDTKFFHMLKETSDVTKIHEPLSIKQITVLTAECCCRQVGEVAFILRISALGEAIITEFQQLMKDPDAFVFRTNKAPSMFQCKRIEGDDPNFCMVGSLYETTTLEDPDVINNAQQKIEVCTELQSCGVGQAGQDYKCEHEQNKDPPKKQYPIEKIRMGDITGPCGNPNCVLAHKVKTYIRNLESYKKDAGGVKPTKDDQQSRKVCGSCVCKDDKWHRDTCPDNPPKSTCGGCGGLTPANDTCEDRKNKLFGTGATPKGSKTNLQINYVVDVHREPNFKESKYGKEFIAQNIEATYKVNSDYQSQINMKLLNKSDRGSEVGGYGTMLSNKPTYKINKEYDSSQNMAQHNRSGCGCGGGACGRGGCGGGKCFSLPPNNTSNTDYYVTKSSSTPTVREPVQKCSSRSLNENNDRYIYNLEAIYKRDMNVYNCTQIPDDKDCRCDPPKPKPPCNTFDCDCITEAGNIAARKAHKPYCPQYKHKPNCPVTQNDKEDDKKKVDDDDDEAEPLPYGLPPIQLGPCPVMGRPCSVPDGFARMYKTGALPPAIPSYSDAGKVCCSKEYERIKKAIKEYLKSEKDHDFRCINKFNVDTERRCCDKEQRLLALTGRSCCGSHKLAIQEKFKDETKK
ncbi:uncharacterized protein LOC128676936 isoform X1 [Plodia interpunctella]|uniref:uncharacterized protein LOC128676936 isoform X1 n=1 Tax=Plodia interpunctella TaxID=58824 RepID=UPI0023685A4B|nr:uncharacterized protein LOC128676936 isoform X1 [Plodia interpunctella]